MPIDLRSQLRAGQRSAQDHVAQGVADEGESSERAPRGAGMGLEEFRHLLCEALPHVLKAVPSPLLGAGQMGTEAGEGVIFGREKKQVIAPLSAALPQLHCSEAGVVRVGGN